MALYPPIVASSMPAFDITTGSVRIYFAISDYNGAKSDDIKAVHITVRRQTSNVNVLNSVNEMIEKEFNQETYDSTTGLYYIEINNSDLVNGFLVDVLYKVQLRFSSKLAPTDTSLLATFYSNNILSFSEWSTVCIIKAINPPTFYIDLFHVDGENPDLSDINYFRYSLADFIGVYKQTNTIKDSNGNTIDVTSSEVLEKWRIRLLSPVFQREDLKDIDKYTLADSGVNIISAYNYSSNNASVVFDCSLAYELTDSEEYKLYFLIETRNGYTNSIIYDFICKPQAISELSGTLRAAVNEEEGYIKLEYNSVDNYLGNLVIRRSSSKSNFLKWEDLKNFESYNISDFTYYDFTALSGIMYRYLVQKRDSRGRRGTPLYSLTYVMGEWEHAFLLLSVDSTSLDTIQQLKLKFDFQISSYKTNISESRTDTIGSKYPFIRRNGNMYYRSFPCTGTITGLMDNTDLFTSAEYLYDLNLEKYNSFKGNYDKWVNRYDYVYERKFRELALKFLYNSKPKLYKSMQEGNILIKLMLVSLTPKNELGRLIYTFSATAYEIDEASISNFDRYDFIHIGNYNPLVAYSEVVLQQLTSFKDDNEPMGNLFKAGYNIIGTGLTPAANSPNIASKIKYNKGVNGQVVTNFQITWLRMTIESLPYLIILDKNGTYRPIDDIVYDELGNRRPNIDIISKPIELQLYQIKSRYNGSNIYLGTLFQVDDQYIIVSHPNNIYEFKDDGVKLTPSSKIIPMKDTAMTVDYVIQLTIQEDISDVPKIIKTDTTNGQLVGPFDANTLIVLRVNYKYKHDYLLENTGIIKQYCRGIKTINIDTDPGVIIEAKTTAQASTLDTYRFIVNGTGELFFDPCDPTVYINSFIIKGKNCLLTDLTDRRNLKYYDLSLIKYPVNMDLVTIVLNDLTNLTQDYVYYKKNFYKAYLKLDGTYDLLIPIEALIFYYADIRRDVY